MAARPRLAHLVPKRLAASVRPNADEESDDDKRARLRKRYIVLAFKAADAAEHGGDPTPYVTAMRGIEAALRLLGDVAIQLGAPAVVVTVGPDEEAERLGDDDLGTERPADASQLT